MIEAQRQHASGPEQHATSRRARQKSDPSDADDPSTSSARASGGGLTLDAFDPHVFVRGSEMAIAKLADHLADASVRGLKLTDPAVLSRAARALMTTESDRVVPFDEKRLAGIIDLYVATGIPVYSPGAMGRQFSGVVPLASLVDLVSAVVNQPSSFYEAGQLPNVAEHIMADELNKFIGWDPTRFTMVTTSGGSLANLTALLAARNDQYPRFWPDGAAAIGTSIRPAIAVGENVHYSVTRAAGILGIGEAQIVRLPLNKDRQICMDRARPALASAERQGMRVFCLVASAGSTSTGSFDPLDELADLAREKGCWLHVDGAHGASLLVSESLRHKLAGLDRADSLTWDAHKMMFVPAPCTLLFYKDREKSVGAFRQDASYVFDEKPDIYTALDSGDKNFETTKRPMIMGLWTLWAVYGRALFAEKIEYLCDLTRDAHQVLCDAPDFETPHIPESNILCFRHRPSSLPAEKVHDFQNRLRNRIKARGRFFISKVNLDGVAALRVVMMNHQTSVEHFRMLLDEVRATGQEILDEEESNSK